MESLTQGSIFFQNGIAPLYNFMISKGFEVTISDINPSKVHVLGTPEELKEFLNEN